MTSRLHKGGRAAARAIAIFGAALILVSQSIGAAHFHEGAASRDGIVVAQFSADPGFCPVCQLALHSPGSVTAAATVARGPAIAETIFLAAPIRSESPVFSAARVRAPPVSL
ncbi:MAG: hypothetical protein ACLP0B_16780 [Steroidobacteraceae bacterium]